MFTANTVDIHSGDPGFGKKLFDVSFTRYVLVFWSGVFLYFRTWETLVPACLAFVVYALEVEANLIGQNGQLMAELARKIAQPNLVCIFDGGNISSQNYDCLRCLEEYRAMKKHLGYFHIKDYRIDPSLEWTGVVDEERLKNFVPADIGDSGHEAILRDFRDAIPAMERKLKRRGIPGVFLDLEPHV